MKHGLTAETVVAVFENAGDYNAFQRQMMNQYRPRSMIEGQLVLRLTSLLWRLHRATAIETGLFHIQGQIIKDRKVELRKRDQVRTNATAALYKRLGFVPASIPDDRRTDIRSSNSQILSNQSIDVDVRSGLEADPTEETNFPKIAAQCFMRIARLDSQILDRLNRYETALWRQTIQVMKSLVAKEPRFRN